MTVGFLMQLVVGVCVVFWFFLKLVEACTMTAWIYFSSNYRKISSLPCFSLKYLIISHLAIIRYCIIPATLNEVKEKKKKERNLRLFYSTFKSFKSLTVTGGGGGRKSIKSHEFQGKTYNGTYFNSHSFSFGCLSI